MKKNVCSKKGCWNRIHADSCNLWLDVEPHSPLQIEVDEASMELCKARHETPATDGAIFETEVNPLSVEELQRVAKARLASLDIRKLNLYVTGLTVALTVALVAVLNAAKELNIKVTLWHYNRETNDYYAQKAGKQTITMLKK